MARFIKVEKMASVRLKESEKKEEMLQSPKTTSGLGV